MNRSTLIGLVAGGVIAMTGAAVASYKINQEAQPQFAEVLAATPVTKAVRTPREVCHDVVVREKVPTQDPKQVAGTALGAVVGGVLGNQIGGGSGKTVATVAGAAAGGYAGNRIQKRMQDGNTVETTQRRCSTVYDTEKRTVGYDVRYRFDGREAVIRTRSNPGPRILVKDGQLVLNEATVPVGTTRKT